MISTCTGDYNYELPKPQMNSDPGEPLLPGLVVLLDNNIIFVFVAGFVQGIYFLTASGKISTSIRRSFYSSK
jgi:hypothetical protein